MHLVLFIVKIWISLYWHFFLSFSKCIVHIQSHSQFVTRFWKTIKEVEKSTYDSWLHWVSKGFMQFSPYLLYIDFAAVHCYLQSINYKHDVIVFYIIFPRSTNFHNLSPCLPVSSLSLISSLPSLLSLFSLSFRISIIKELLSYILEETCVKCHTRRKTKIL